MKRIAVLLAFIGIAPASLVAQEPEPRSEPQHVAVESTVLVLDEARVRRLGVDAVVVSAGDGAVGASSGHPRGGVRAGTRVGGLDVAAFLDLVRRERAIRREATQRILTLSGSAAEVSSQHTFVGVYGQAASAGPALWVEPVALEDGRVRLRVWTVAGEVRAGPFGSVWEDVPAGARTEITVRSGAPVVIATTDESMERTDRELLRRGSTSTATQAWIVVRARIIDDPSEAFELPAGIPKEWQDH